MATRVSEEMPRREEFCSDKVRYRDPKNKIHGKVKTMDQPKTWIFPVEPVQVVINKTQVIIHD